MTTQQTEALRERWRDWLEQTKFHRISDEQMADWWIDEFSQALEREREEVREELNREMTTFEIDTAGGKQEVWLKEDVLTTLLSPNK